jgi:hypothetical protein
VKLLQYLQRQFPREGWGDYIVGDSVQWSRIITSGHSQGGGHAAYIATTQDVERVIIFSSTDWLNRLNRPADWMSLPKRTAASRFYGFVHEGDELLPYSIQVRGWQVLGMGAFGENNGNVVTVDSVPAPYRKGRMLRTFAATGFPNPLVQFHNATVANGFTPRTANSSFIFAPVWTYMLTDGLATSVREIAPSPSLIISPNPASNLISVQGVESVSELALMNVLGQMVIKSKIEQMPATLDVSSLPSGIYLLQINTKQTIHTQTVQVLR